MSVTLPGHAVRGWQLPPQATQPWRPHADPATTPVGSSQCFQANVSRTQKHQQHRGGPRKSPQSMLEESTVHHPGRPGQKHGCFLWPSSTCWVMAPDCFLGTNAGSQRPPFPGGLWGGRVREDPGRQKAFFTGPGGSSPDLAAALSSRFLVLAHTPNHNFADHSSKELMTCVGRPPTPCSQN